MRSLLPPQILGSQSYSYDLLPPSRSSRATFYDEDYFASVGGRQQSHQHNVPTTQTLVERALALLNGGQAQDVELEDFLREQFALVEVAGERGLPGRFPDANGTDIDDVGEGEDQAEDAREPARQAPMARIVNAFQGWFNRGNAQARVEREDDVLDLVDDA